ncbi:MAG: uroporphyrinogen decarboxylase family protein [Candidatus Poribacteria bacterium]
MTSRQRVLDTINHKEPDKVPVDLGGMRSTGIMAIAYNRLKKHLGYTKGETLVYDVVQQLAQPEQEILNFVEADVIDLGQAFLDKREDWQDWTLPDGSAAKIPAWVELTPQNGGWVVKSDDGTVIGEMPAGVEYINQCHWPLMEWREDSLENLPEAMEKVTWGALPTAPWHEPLTDEYLTEIKRRAKHLYETTDYAIMAAFGGNLLEWGQFLRRFDNFLLDIVGDPKRVESLLDKLVEIHLANLEKFLPAVGDYIQIIQMGDDLGTQQAAQISPKTYREIFKPRHKIIYDYIKKHSNARLFLHTCGSVVELLPDLIDIGVEILNPVQTSAAGMQPERLKREFGRDITFWGGGCDTQQVLPYGTPQEIDGHVKERIEIFAPDGGFVFSQVHNIVSNVPPENVVAMYEAVKRYR